MRRYCLLLCLCLNATAFAHDETLEDCAPDVADEVEALYEEVLQVADVRQRELLETAQQAWLVYRQANCELLGRAEDGFATCRAFFARERALELRLLGQVLP